MSDPLAAEIARLRARAAPPDPLAEIAALRARIARIEAAALAATTPTEGAPNMENAIRDHYTPTTPPDKERARLESIARGFVADPQSEAALVARAKDPAAFDTAQRAMHADGLALSLYSRGREAAIAVGAYTPKEGTK
jgi:hypothetical protein